MKRKALACASGHHLDEERPAREIAGLDGIEKVAAVAFTVLANQSFGLGIGEVLNSLLRPEVEFDPDALVRRID